MLNLPKELLLLIIDFLDVSSLFALNHTCKNYLQNKTIKFNLVGVNIVRLNAAKNGYLTIFKWLMPLKPPSDTKIIHSLNCKYIYTQIACENGHLDILKYLHENEYSEWYEYKCCNYVRHLNIYVSSYAAENGHLNILKYLYENGCPWDGYTCASAAENGHLDALKYLHENGCPWNGYVYRCAIEGGHLNTLKYLHDNGCPQSIYEYNIAADRGHLDILEYLHEN